MDWFEMSVKAPGDAKFLNLAARLKEPLAFGYVVRIYAHCYLHEIDRFTGPGAVAAIEQAAGWRGKTGRFVAVLLEPDVAVLDQAGADDFVVHGVGPRLEAAVKRRGDAADRKKKWREERVRNASGTRDGTRDETGTGRDGTPYQTRPDLTRPDQLDQKLLSDALRAPVDADAIAALAGPPPPSLFPAAPVADGAPAPAPEAVETTAPKPKRSTASETDPRFAPLRAAWVAEFAEAFGGADYRWSAADSQGVHRVIAVTVPDFRDRARRGLRATGWLRCGTVAKLTSNEVWNQLASAVTPARGASNLQAASKATEFKRGAVDGF